MSNQPVCTKPATHTVIIECTTQSHSNRGITMPLSYSSDIRN